MTTPLVTIVIPVYNAAPHLAACIESVRKQTYENIEILLTKTDGTVIDLSGSANNLAGHGGGDGGLMDHMYELISSGGTQGLTSVDASVESHVMALAAEASRVAGGKTIELATFR